MDRASSDGGDPSTGRDGGDLGGQQGASASGASGPGLVGTLRGRAGLFLSTLPNRLYSGPVKRVSRRLGLESTLRRLYLQAFVRVVDGTVDIEVEGVTASFHVRTPAEYNRLRGRLLETNRPILEDLLAHLEPTDVVWDVGAHVGRYSCVVGQVVDPGNLVAVEAHPENVESLRSNLELNHVDATGIHGALADAVGEATFSLALDEAGEFIAGSEYTQGVAEDHEKTVTVDTVTGESLVDEQGLPSPDVVRMDIGGGEPSALDGMADLLRNARCRLVYASVYRDRYDDPEAVESRLHEFGFEVSEMDETTLRAVRPDDD